MKVCENCGNEHDGEYGSGRFCSVKCSRGFSTKAKRKEIGMKISKALTKDNLVTKKCPYCHGEFKVKPSRIRKKFCSVHCAAKGRLSEKDKENMSRKISKIRSEGSFKFNSILNYYPFKDKIIRCDSMKESNGLDAIIDMYGDEIIDIRRSDLSLPYYYDNKKRYFNPDFIIIFNNGEILLEVKTKINKDKNGTQRVRPLYFFTVEEKKKAMKKYCKENNMQYCWYDGDLYFD